MPGVKVVGDPRPKGSMHCIGPRKCRSCDAVVVHNLQPDDPSGKGKEWRERLERAGRALHNRLGFTYEGPVSVDATFVVARPAAAAKRPYPHIRSAGDLDKLTRMLLDAFTVAGVWTDDALVCELNVRKQYPGTVPELTGPGVVVRVELMVDPDALPLEGGQ